MKHFGAKWFVTFLFVLIYCTGAVSGELIINTDASDPAPKAAFEAAVKGFESENRDVKVKVNTFEHEAYKTAFREMLTREPPDIVTWYAGNRMAPFVNDRLFEDVTNLWFKENLPEKFQSSVSSMMIKNKLWGLPYTYYQWGIYYRKDIFAKYGIAEPKNWQELLRACVKLKAAKIYPFAIGTKVTWTTGGWFDYINLRLNGYSFHKKLTSGEIPYTDIRVQSIFGKWDELTKPGYYLSHHENYDWKDAIHAFAKGQAAMYLIGNFAVAPMKEAGLKESQIGYMRFPGIAPGLPRSEDAPTDTIHIPTGAKNKVDARRFMIYLARADVQGKMNDILGQLPVNNEAPIPSDTYLRAGFSTLSRAFNLSQFYDRDVPAEMAKEGMDGFQQYMLKPTERQAILERLELVRQRVYATK